MRNKKILYIILACLFAVILASSIYVNFIAKSIKLFDYILIGQIFLGIGASMITLFLGLNIFNNKKTYELLFVGFLEILLVLSIVVFNYINGYGGVVDSNNYVDHMNYVSMEFNIYIYIIFVGIIGLLTLNSFVSEKLVLLNKKEENVDTLEEKA